MARVRRNLTLQPETVSWLAQQENASEYVDALCAYAKAFELPSALALRIAVIERARDGRAK